MRVFIFLLLLANIAYLAWNSQNPPESPPLMATVPSVQASRSLQLLSEVVREVEPEPAPVETCISLGIFNTIEESDFLVSALLERGMQARAELLQSDDVLNFRVYMPPFNSETAARQTLEALQAGGIESFIISSGELAGGISLGLFSQEALALAQQETLAAQGFATSIQEVTTTRNEIWVTIEGLSQALLEGSELLDLLSQGLDLEVIEKPCETIASRP